MQNITLCIVKKRARTEDSPRPDENTIISGSGQTTMSMSTDPQQLQLEHPITGTLDIKMLSKTDMGDFWFATNPCSTGFTEQKLKLSVEKVHDFEQNR
jgi:hypothetical protein